MSDLASRSRNTQDFDALGLLDGVTTFNKFGYRTASTAAGGEETIWATNTNLTVMTTAGTFDITYNSSTDGEGTTGALSLLITYIDANEDAATATHTLGSDGSDTTSFTGLGINRVVVLSSGTANTNTNDITITATTGGSTQAIIPALGSVTQQAIFHVPDNQRAVAKLLYINCNKLSGSSPKVTFKGIVYNRGTATTYEVFRHVMDTAVENTLVLTDPVGFPFSARDVLYFVMDTDTNDTIASLRFSLNLYRTS